ncbi:MAG: efflux RND transporter periplasmic adaptor subunit [candidate division NC10 bacterium]|nr:efflux RND transporter periplasmic adaptor subunit [candidate division NC10 bacterium]
MMRTTRILVITLCGFVLAAVGCSREKSGAPAANAAPGERKITISVAQADGRDVERTVQIVGTLLAQEEVTLANEVPATLGKILVDLGDRVRKGQVVIQLDEREARLEVERAIANLQAAREALARARQMLDWNRANVERSQAVLSDAQTNLKRFQDLFAEGAISASQRDSAQTQSDVALASVRANEAQYESDRAAAKNAEANVEQASTALELARKRLRDTEIVAPFDGFVRKRLVNVGETYKEKTPLMSLVAIQALKLQGEVPERFAPRLGAGRPVRVEVEAYPGRTFTGTITRVSPAVDVESRTFTVEASVPNPGGVLKPGFFAKASILTGVERNVPFVPEEAVVTFAGIVKVYVIADGKAEERRVTTGQRRDGRVEILEGVKVGETVASSGLSQLATGTTVAVQAGARGAPSPDKADTGNRKLETGNRKLDTGNRK